MNYSKKIFAAAVAALILSSSGAAAEELELRGIMKDLGSRAGAIATAIAVGDFDAVEKNAEVIADHPKPALTERLKILAFLMTEAPGFKAADETLHASAAKLKEAAKAKDYDGAIARFSEMLGGCVKCHAGYRAKIIERFYGAEKK